MAGTALLLHFGEDRARAEDIAEAAGLAIAGVARHRFPDGEVKLQLPAVLPERVVVFRTLDHPNEKLIELLLAAGTARTLGARHLTLVSPYLAYMRQDTAFAPGETVSQHIVGSFLAGLFDAVITVDPHLHRVNSLRDAIPVEQAIALSGAELLADLVARHRPQALLMGPDEESEQWVAKAAARHNTGHGVCRKIRHGDRAVEIELPRIDVARRSVVLMDDVASTGATMARAAQMLLAAGAASVDIAVTHALFAEDAIDRIQRAGVGAIWSTDCIEHSSNAVSVAPMIGAALKSLIL